MATKNCQPCIDIEHDGFTYCGVEDCACCGKDVTWSFYDKEKNNGN